MVHVGAGQEGKDDTIVVEDGDLVFVQNGSMTDGSSLGSMTSAPAKLWGYALFPDRVGDFVPKPMAECTGAEILQELCGHMRFDPETVESANCIPCRMPYITSMFMPRTRSDRPRPVPRGSKNLAFISQFVEIADDVVFTVEYSVRAAQIAVYELFGVQRKIPPITPHDKSLRTQFEALVKAFK